MRAVIFDSDGTLVDSEAPGLDVVYTLAREAGLTLGREQAHDRFRGVRMAEVAAFIAAQLPQCGPSFATEFTQRVRVAMAARFQQGLSPMPGAKALVERLRLPFAVATNGPREKIEQTLRLTGLRPYFEDRVFCAYEVGHFKPDPGLFLHAAGALGIEPSCCAVVEDSLPGITAGLAAGMRVFALQPARRLPDHLAARVTCIDSLEDLQIHWAQHLAPG